MVLQRVTVEGYESLLSELGKCSYRTLILFTASKNSGKSWCPDCVEAEPAIENVLKDVQSSSYAEDNNLRVIECFVGQREYWKDKQNPFRTDPKFSVSCIPTLMEYGAKSKRLSEAQLRKEDLIRELIECED
ncbi:hypothetical protein AB6A40_007468 [Gnathostoma spinigerum]|uniref:Thioredoxin domain-containing protein 17 n=1 Tax=Gnathostoma spinigerum TaxID=75299 RepID=A0ABD6ELB2_9BILA